MEFEPSPFEAYILQYWLWQEYLVACQIYAARRDYKEKRQDPPTFYLNSQQGVARVKVFGENRSSLILRSPLLSEGEIRIRFTPESTYVSDGNGLAVETVAPVVTQMEIAPYPRSLYGLVYSGSVMGLTFFAPRFQPEQFCWLSRGEYRLRIFTRGNISGGFPFVNEPDPVVQLSQFWSAYLYGTDIGPKVVYLGTALKREKIPIKIKRREGGSFCLEFGRDFRATYLPRLYPGYPYVMWDSKSGCHSPDGWVPDHPLKSNQFHEWFHH